MPELWSNNPKYYRRLHELRREFLDLLLSPVPQSQEAVVAAGRAYYEWQWVPPDSPVRLDPHPLWEANVDLAKRCAELAARMAEDAVRRAVRYASSMTCVWAPQDFPEHPTLPDEMKRHHYLCAWLAAAWAVDGESLTSTGVSAG